jgi:polyhydroxyalkanoate synthesis regulator phasin
MTKIEELIQELDYVVKDTKLSKKVGEDGLPKYEKIPFGSGVVLQDVLRLLQDLEGSLDLDVLESENAQVVEDLYKWGFNRERAKEHMETLLSELKIARLQLEKERRDCRETISEALLFGQVSLGEGI